ncbi:MAG: hypothetical protein PWP15_1049 [Methanothermococcus sp.]|jgi:hypothetical protein|uniref:DUF1894 domain-containing protein n=1 Tax=Methanothermococcus TaxID=155862 RepID=UPI0003621F43|nr:MULTISPECIES: DUF1894 domain-containing protein [Methanothermococcus]MDK2790542.1 hypothetical protein [Methanothermococcus sp.]MDK2987247.1 hypothetical protein [Methanothermococcus sp.]
MSCIDNYNYEILFNGSFKECAEYIKKNYKNIRELNAGEEIVEGVMLIGIPPIPVGYDENYVVFPYTKPCYGSYVLRVPMEEYIKSNKKVEDRKKKKEEGEGLLSKLKFW